MTHSPAVYIVFARPLGPLPLVTIDIDRLFPAADRRQEKDALAVTVIGESSTDSEVEDLIRWGRLPHADLCRWMDDGGSGDDSLI